VELRGERFKIHWRAIRMIIIAEIVDVMGGDP
jgi:hypothetical protein